MPLLRDIKDGLFSGEVNETPSSSSAPRAEGQQSHFPPASHILEISIPISKLCKNNFPFISLETQR